MKEEHVIESLPGYALGILEEAELLRVAEHLSGCAACQRELRAYSETADRLLYAVPQRDPAHALKAQVLQRVEGAAQRRAPAAAQPAGIAGPVGWLAALRSLLGSPAGALAFGALALLVLFLGINNFLLWQQVNDLRARIPGDHVQVVRMVGTADSSQAAGYVLVFENDHYGSLTVEHAPILEAGYQYQIWLIKNGARTSGGVFSVNEEGYGTLQIDADQPLDVFDSFGITVEPAGGSPAPTGEKILGGDL